MSSSRDHVLSSSFTNLLIFIVEHYIRVLEINMEKFNIDYSTKNIPIPSEREYMIQLISKVEKFIKRMRRNTVTIPRETQ